MSGRIATVGLACVGVSVVALTAFWRPAPVLIWNASASVPVGLYAVRSPGTLTIGELVVVQPPEPLAAFLANGGYLPLGAPLIKHVAALAGETVCRNGAAVSIDGVVLANAHERDHASRLLPVWSGCRRIVSSEVFLLNAGEPASLDGRYFGTLPVSSIVGRAVPLWTGGSH